MKFIFLKFLSLLLLKFYKRAFSGNYFMVQNKIINLATYVPKLVDLCGHKSAHNKRCFSEIGKKS